jgi:hypothetical protein
MQMTPSSCESPRDDCQHCSHDFTYCSPISEIRSRPCESADQQVQSVLRQRRRRSRQVVAPIVPPPVGGNEPGFPQAQGYPVRPRNCRRKEARSASQSIARFLSLAPRKELRPLKRRSAIELQRLRLRIARLHSRLQTFASIPSAVGSSAAPPRHRRRCAGLLQNLFGRAPSARSVHGKLIDTYVALARLLDTVSIP